VEILSSFVPGLESAGKGFGPEKSSVEIAVDA